MTGRIITYDPPYLGMFPPRWTLDQVGDEDQAKGGVNTYAYEAGHSHDHCLRICLGVG